MTFLGVSIVQWVISLFIAVCVFFILQWLIPLIAGAIGLNIPGNIVNIIAILIAVGLFYGGFSWRRTTPS